MILGVAIILFRELCLSWRSVVTLPISPLETSTIPRLLCHSWPFVLYLLIEPMSLRAQVLNVDYTAFRTSHHECRCLLSSIISARVSCTCEYEVWEFVTPRWMKRYRSMCFFRYRPRYRSTFETRSTWEKMAREWIHQFLPWKLYWRVPWVTETTPLTSCDVKPLLRHTHISRCRISCNRNILLFWMKINLWEIFRKFLWPYHKCGYKYIFVQRFKSSINFMR